MIVNKLHASLLPALPLLLLLLALSTVFLFSNDRGHFYRPGHDRYVTTQTLAVVRNLSPDHNFLGFLRQTLDAAGAPTYQVYNRFPISSYLLIKLAIIPFGDDLSAQLYAARLLMLLFFTATAVLAYLSLTRLMTQRWLHLRDQIFSHPMALSLARLTTHRWLALTATLLAFSSPYCLYYNDMVATDVGPDLFGVFLVFHGMVLFVQEGRFRQLLGKTCLALLLGWHVYALLLPFVVLGLAGALVKAVRGGEGYKFWEHLARAPASLLRSRYLVLGVVALLFGTAVLSVNFANEYVALHQAQGLTDLPVFQAIQQRTGQLETFNTQYAKQVAWPFFLRSQFHRIAGMFLPYSLTGEVDHGPYLGDPIRIPVYLGIVLVCTCLIGLAFLRHRILWATLVLSGFCWGLAIRHSTAFHDFESLFYIGLPLLLFSLVLLCIHRLSGRRLSVVVGLSVAALVVFVLSTFQMGARVGHTAEAAERQKNVMADFAVIRKITAGKVVRVPQKAFFEFNPCSIHYYLTGSIILFSTDESNSADFLIRCHRHESAALLTPENKKVFLYRSDGQ